MGTMNDISGKRFLITGGTGSFGKTVAKKLASCNAQEIRIFSRDEEKQDSMRNSTDGSSYSYFIGDVRDKNSVNNAMKGIDHVFHAAALKQVPSCEFFPIEAVKTNIIGSANVLEAANANNVSSVVCLSTDKAVFPVNAMGMTKALMEKVAQAATRSTQDNNCRICCVRYGNVMYSRGSVIPRFVKQIKDGEPLTLTDPNMTRFLMPLTDAVDLVLYAFENSVNGDVFIKKAPSSSVLTLANALCKIFEAKNELQHIGVRHGEKMYETLLSSEELLKSSDLGDYFRIPLDSRTLDYEKYFTEGSHDIGSADEYNSNNAKILSESEVIELLTALPEIQTELTK